MGINNTRNKDSALSLKPNCIWVKLFKELLDRYNGTNMWKRPKQNFDAFLKHKYFIFMNIRMHSFFFTSKSKF